MRSNLKGGGVREEKLTGHWWFHPENEKTPTDVAVAPINFYEDEEFAQLLLRHHNPPKDQVPVAGTAGVLKDANLGLGDEVLITGLFRSHYGQQRNVPIVRVGNIAMMKGEPVYTEYCGPTEAYLVEARSISGLSGSPVFVHCPIWQLIDNLPQMIIGGPFYLLGLMHGHFDIKNLNEDVVVDNEEETTRGINTGVGVVIPVEKILETIDHPELIEMRKKAKEEFRKRHGATSDFSDESAPPANDANPKHREDFNSLLDAAVKKREPKD